MLTEELELISLVSELSEAQGLRLTYSQRLEETRPKLAAVEAEISSLEPKRRAALALGDREKVVACDRSLKVANLQRDEWADTCRGCEAGLQEVGKTIANNAELQREAKTALNAARARLLVPEYNALSEKLALLLVKIYPLAANGRAIGLVNVLPDYVKILDSENHPVCLWSKHSGLDENFKRTSETI